ncbi:MAG TPA: MFS transporter [Beijerinckiaceae bacterium]|nr:MFS transporter [Beijerinckiaceae bacterium]HVB89789.1 MFS transporter [Beijerinckiaceae bacterium]
MAALQRKRATGQCNSSRAAAVALASFCSWAKPLTAIEPPGVRIRTSVPARLELLPWGRFHSLVVVALGITWVLDGLEVTLAGSVAGALKASPVLKMSDVDVGFAGSLYLVGAVVGALLFGWLTDRMGRKKLFFVTLTLYLAATALTAASWSKESFWIFRLLTGAGVGGEYTAINSTIQELVPARYRGWTDLVINGSFWIGAALGAGGSIVFLDSGLLPPETGWRAAFMIGATLGLGILVMRLWIPESPRWLVIHGRQSEAERVIAGIEERFTRAGVSLKPAEGELVIETRTHTPLREVFFSLFVTHRQRALVCLALMTAQAFFYNAIFFTYALVLIRFYNVSAGGVGWYVLPFALGNVLGPLILGRLFDTIGRRPMIAGTYIVSGLLLAFFGLLFEQGMLSAAGQTLAWSVVFFFASPAASAAYLTVSECFPLEIRALAIAVFYALGTGLGGVAAPLLFGRLVESGSRASVFGGYLIGAALMLAAGGVAARWAVAAERRPLEDVARPLSMPP